MEIWKNIEGTDGRYQVSNEGRVKRLPIESEKFCYKKGENVFHNTDEYILKTIADQSGYLLVHIPRGKGIPRGSVHRLVAKAFIPIPEELKQFEGTQNLQVNHKNEDKTDNRVSNLEWCTAKYNSNYGTRNERMGAKLKGRRPSDATIKAMVERCRRAVEKYTKDDVYLETYESIAEAARQNENVHHANIVKCCQGKIKSTGGFKWKYADN